MAKYVSSSIKLKFLHGNRDLSFVTRKGIESGDRLEICFDLGYLVVSFISVNIDK